MQTKKKKPILKNKGEWIALRRGCLGLSQTDLANLTGLSRVGISLIERGLAQPRTITLGKIERVLKNYPESQKI